MSIIPVADAKAHLEIKLADTEHDATLQRMLDAAEDIVVEHIGPFASVEVTEDVGTTFGVAVLRRRPIQSITSVTIAGAVQGSVRANLPAGLLFISEPATVVYVVGFGALPALVREVVLDLVRLRFEARPGGLPRGVEVAEETVALPFPTDDAAILARLTPHRHAPSVG